MILRRSVRRELLPPSTKTGPWPRKTWTDFQPWQPESDHPQRPGANRSEHARIPDARPRLEISLPRHLRPPRRLRSNSFPATAEQSLPEVKGSRTSNSSMWTSMGGSIWWCCTASSSAVFRRGAKDEIWGNELTVGLPTGMEHVIVATSIGIRPKFLLSPVTAVVEKERKIDLPGSLRGFYPPSSMAFPDFVLRLG